MKFEEWLADYHAGEPPFTAEAEADLRAAFEAGQSSSWGEPPDVSAAVRYTTPKLVLRMSIDELKLSTDRFCNLVDIQIRECYAQLGTPPSWVTQFNGLCDSAVDHWYRRGFSSRDTMISSMDYQIQQAVLRTRM
jgi:hypothetical protein